MSAEFNRISWSEGTEHRFFLSSSHIYPSFSRILPNIYRLFVHFRCWQLQDDVCWTNLYKVWLHIMARLLMFLKPSSRICTSIRCLSLIKWLIMINLKILSGESSKSWNQEHCMHQSLFLYIFSYPLLKYFFYKKPVYMPWRTLEGEECDCHQCLRKQSSFVWKQWEWTMQFIKNNSCASNICQNHTLNWEFDP